MKKVLIILLMTSTAVFAYHPKKELLLWSTIPDSFQGEYSSILVSVRGKGFTQLETVFAVMGERAVKHSGETFVPDAIYTIDEKTMTLNFDKINRYWTVYKTGYTSCVVVVEDTKEHAEILRIISSIK